MPILQITLFCRYGLESVIFQHSFIFVMTRFRIIIVSYTKYSLLNFRHSLVHWVTILMLYMLKKIMDSFLHFQETFLHMQIVMIIIGVDIIHQDHFINEWTEFFFHIWGISKEFCLFCIGCRKSYKHLVVVQLHHHYMSSEPEYFAVLSGQ